MKNLSFIIILSSLVFIFNVSYDLQNGIEKTLSLSSSQTYNFYISITHLQSASITLIFEGLTSLPLVSYETYIYEYQDRYSSSSIRKEQIYFTTSEKNNQLIATEKYAARRKAVNYMALSIKPNSNIDSMTIKINVAGGAYELTNGVSRTVYNLIGGHPYFLIIPAQTGYKITFDLALEEFDKNPFDGLRIYEFEDTECRYSLFDIAYYFSFSSENNEKKVPTLSYVVRKSGVNMVAIRVYPDNNIYYIRAQVVLETFYYDFYFENSKNLKNLKAGNSYNFYMQSKFHQIANISFSATYNSLYKPFNNIKICERDYKCIDHQISFTTETFYYQLTEQYTKSLSLEILPNYDIPELNISCNILEGEFDLESGISKEIMGLVPGVSYYFFIYTYPLKTINTQIITDYMSSQPFSSINVSELYVKSVDRAYTFTEKEISFTKNNNQLETRFEYTNTYGNLIFTLFEIKPQKKINYMNISIDMGGEIYTLLNGVSQQFDDLKSTYKYYLFIDIKKNQKANINLNFRNIEQNIPFDYVYIYELNYHTTHSQVYHSFYSMNQDKKGDELILSFSYKATKSSTNSMLIEIKPNHDLDYITAKIEIKSSDNNSTLTIVLVTVIVLIIIIGASVFFFIRKKYYNNNSNSINNLPQNEQPLNLYPEQ